MSKIPFYTPGKLLRYGGTNSNKIIQMCEIEKREREMRMEQNRKDNLERYLNNIK